MADATPELPDEPEPEPVQYEDPYCDYCLCCGRDACWRGPGSPCPRNALGESICPCSED